MSSKYTCGAGHVFGSPYKEGLSQETIDAWCLFCHPEKLNEKDLTKVLDLPQFHYFRAVNVTKPTYEKLLQLRAEKMIILDGKSRWTRLDLIFRESGLVLVGKFRHHRETHVLELRPWVVETLEHQNRKHVDQVGIAVQSDDEKLAEQYPVESTTMK